MVVQDICSYSLSSNLKAVLVRIKWRSLRSTQVCGSFTGLVSRTCFAARIPSLCGMLV